jgi:hypothetical protein
MHCYLISASRSGTVSLDDQLACRSAGEPSQNKNKTQTITLPVKKTSPKLASSHLHYNLAAIQVSIA